MLMKPTEEYYYVQQYREEKIEYEKQLATREEEKEYRFTEKPNGYVTKRKIPKDAGENGKKNHY